MSNRLRLVWGARLATYIAIVTCVGIGVGVATAVFSMAHHLLLRSVPGVANIEGIVSLYVRPSETSRFSGAVSDGHLDAMRRLPAFASVAAHSTATYPVRLSSDADVTMERVVRVTEGFFEVLGVRAAQGRVFTASDYSATADAPVVISERFWRQRMGGRPDAVGRTLSVNAHSFTVVGILDAFHGLGRLRTDDLWIPLGSTRLFSTATSDNHREMVGRLSPGVSLETARLLAQPALDAVGRVTSRNPVEGGEFTHRLVLFRGLTDGIESPQQRIAAVLTAAGATALVLVLLACANAAQLLISQGLRRRFELRMKAILGASHLRLCREGLEEAFVLSVFAGVVAFGVAALVLRLCADLHLLSYLPPLGTVPLSWPAFAAAGLTSVTTMTLAAGWPVWSSSRQAQQATTARTTQHGGRTRQFLMTAQVTLATALLLASAVMGRSLHAMETADLGVDDDNVYTVSVRPGDAGYTYERTRDIFRSLERRLRSTAGLMDAGYGFFGHLSNNGAKANVRAGASLGAYDLVEVRTISAGYIPTLRIHLLRGQLPSEAEFAAPGAATLCLIDESMALRYFGSIDAAIGQELEVQDGMVPLPRTVVGVVAGSGSRDFRTGIVPTVYLASTSGLRIATFHIRASAPPETARSLIRDAILAEAPGLPRPDITTLQGDRQSLIATERTLARLGWIVSLVATLIAVGGVLAVMASLVNERRREFGIRLALGSSTRLVYWLVMRQAATALGIGLGAGVLLYSWADPLLTPYLYGIFPYDPTAMVGAALAISAATAAAAFFPARRAASTDPAISLRAE
jgi:predicted permease